MHKITGWGIIGFGALVFMCPLVGVFLPAWESFVGTEAFVAKFIFILGGAVFMVVGRAIITQDKGSGKVGGDE